MKNEKGITLASLAIYIIVIFIVLATLLTITAYFKSNLNNMEKDAAKFAEFDKFNLYFLEEVKKTDNKIIIEGNTALEEEESNYIEFLSGNKYEYDSESKKIYLKSENKALTIANNIESCTFKTYTEEEKTIINVNIKIANEEKNVEYILDYANKYSNYENDKNYTKNKPKVTIYEDLNGDIAPIPVGYVASKATGETIIENGLVIYEGIDDITDDNVEEAKTTRNQYVWIPINNPSEMYGTDINGNKLGKLYNFDSSGNMTVLNWTETEGVMSWILTSGNGSNREPAYLLDQTNGDESTNNTIGITQELLQEEFNNMVESVEKYKGFYIGRYETGGYNTERAVVRAGEKVVSGTNKNISNVSWYEMYDKTKTLSTNATTARMIWGSQYDQMLKFAECANKITPNKTYSEIETGAVDTDCYKNIYDLCANVYDWTIESTSIDSRVMRGGFCYDANVARNRTNYKIITINYGVRFTCHTLCNSIK